MSDLLDFSPPGQATFSLAGAKARFYDAGTTNPRAVFYDQAQTLPAPVPLTADSSGRFDQVFVAGGAVKVVVTQADDSTGYTLDPCVKVAATGAAAGSISFSPSISNPSTNVQDAIDLISNRNTAARNLIINGQGRVNQRSYASGTPTSGANQYTLDRWRVVVSGQALTFTGNDSKRTMTAPAGGVEQVIEGANIEGGIYVLNWTGTATATVNGVPIAKGGTFSGVPANTAMTIRLTSGTFTDVQFEAGSTATVFERLPIGDELARCQRYFETGTVLFSGNVTSGATYVANAYFAVSKRTNTPSIATVNASLANFPNTISVTPLMSGFLFSAVANGTGAGLLAYTFTASDEL